MTTTTHPLEDLAKRIERAFEAVENPGLIPVLKDHPSYWDTRVDTTEDGFRINLALNDIDPDEVHISSSYGLLTLSSTETQPSEKRSDVEEFQAQTDEANVDPEQLESYVPFSYQITVPGNVDPEEITVAFVEDTLEIQFVRNPEASMPLAG